MTSPAIKTDQLVRPRHVVTAVLVAHDGIRWLPTTLHAVKTQSRPVQRFVVVDTGSGDETRDLLERAVGKSSVLEAPRDSGFGAAVGLATRAFAGAPGLASTRADGGDVVDWVWLLHDDSAPAIRALESMLELADEMPSAAVIGPKVCGWDNPRLLLETGVTLDHGGRRETFLEPGELDHGQHDGDRDVLAVSTAGMLVRRDVWDELRGFDAALPLFRDDVDFGWRAQLAGHRVLVCTRAVVHHAEASANGLRRIACATGRPRRIDRQGVLWTMLANSSAVWFPWVAIRLMVACVVRSVLFVIVKRPLDGWDELRAALSVFGRPLAVRRARKARKAQRRVPAGQIRTLFAARGTRLRHYADSAAERLGSVGHHDDEVTDNRGLGRRLVTAPGALMFLGLLVISLIAQRHVLTGTLHGGALLPAPSGARDLWRSYAASWHDTGFGSSVDAPPYLAILAAIAGVLFGSAPLAVTVLLLGSVPLAGLTAYLAARQVVPTNRMRAWLAATYALLPVATGAVATGRLGTAVAFAVLPLVLFSCYRALVPPLLGTTRGRRASARRTGRRADGMRPAWLAGLVLAGAAAFDPLLYVLLVPLILSALTVAIVRVSATGIGRALVVLAVPPVLLLPWSARLVHHPALLVLGIGQPRSGLQSARLHPLDVLLLHPGGPGLPPVWLEAVVVVAALAGLLQRNRPDVARLGWLLAMDGVIGGLLVSRAHVRSPGGTESVAGWPGVATALLGAGLLMSIAVAGARLRDRLAQTEFGWRQPAASVLAAGVFLTPLAAAAVWVANGTGDVLSSRPVGILPPFVAAESSAHDQARTVVLEPGPEGSVGYSLLRSREVRLGDADFAPDAGQLRIVDRDVADLSAGLGEQAATELAHAGIRYVMVPSAADNDLGARIAGGGAVLPQNSVKGWRVWQVNVPAGRLAIAAGDTWQLPPGPVGVGRRAPAVTIPPSPNQRMLVLAEAPAPGWRALALDSSGTSGSGGSAVHRSRTGTPLPVAMVAGEQAFVLPPGSLDVMVSRAPDRRADWLTFQLVALAVIVIGATPGGRRVAGQERPDHVEAELAGAPA